jgi:F-type H+-transporting ATPase subunit a
VIMAVLVVVVVLVLLLAIKRKLSVEAPSDVQQMFELLLSGLEGLIDDVVGHGQGKRFLPFVCGLAVFIFVGNIFGLFYFVQPPTAVPSTTFALSITAFLFYNIVGIRDNGILNHLARILSLALRLFGNIFGEHAASLRFFAMFPLLVPWPMMALGIFGALLQAFIFIMLTMAYLNGAVAHEEAH